MKDKQVVIAPMSGTDSKGFIKSTYTEKPVKLTGNAFKTVTEGTLFFIGIARERLKQIVKGKEIQLIELARRDDTAILNAIPTAEGAIKIAVAETPFTIHGTSTLILGLGRVGMTLGWRLKMLGAKVYAATRSSAPAARGRDLGIKMLAYNELDSYLPQMELVFNTVPAKILTAEYIQHLPASCVIIDLASSPGGTDFSAAEERGLKALLAPGLPGKTAPRTAGKIMADIIPGLIEEKL